VSSHRGDVPERVSEHRRIAVLGGVYANAEALAAVLADTRRRDAEAVFCLGDLGGFGAHPDRVFPLLREHDVRVVRGNYDEAVAAGAADCNCGYTDPRDNHYARLSYAYTVAHTSATNRAWLATLPGHRRARLGPHRVFMCHGSPRRINEFLWESTTPDGLLRRLLADHAADVLLCTHTGLKWRRALDGGAAHAVNVGAVGRPENDGTPDVRSRGGRAGARSRRPAAGVRGDATHRLVDDVPREPPRARARSRPLLSRWLDSRDGGPYGTLHTPARRPAMIRVSVMYPTSEGKKFDYDYYASKHMNGLVRERWGSMGLVKVEVDRGVGGGAPGAPAPYAAVGHVYFRSLEDFQKASKAHGKELFADVPNFTTIAPQVQISEIILS